MRVDFFENGLCFYCHLAKNELLTYSNFHSRAEASWKQQDELLQEELASILEKYPEPDQQDIVDSYGWDLHLNQYKYPDIHRTALVIAIYIFLEDQLNGLCETLCESLDTRLRLSDLNGQGIERALLFLSKIALFDLGCVPSLSFIRDVNRLRNKMVHAGGVLADDPNDKLNVFVQSTNGLRGEPGGRVHIGSEFINNLIDRLVRFFDELDGQVQEFIARAQQGTAADAGKPHG
ncbi:uncharacterized protein sS8_0026 [Methylocaldum marinum]|uniref:RiboL-PSP-HEPN domain-containing protein n=1 Tax=Methylocaldum marinum TaxID=1432792 RepID=A0A286T717_9GAMM|nr:hypothetical protein [Methylocaldum marinum]BBA31996.1 uncharacterized protein sS8_0026 [Methylocaldum marinum]